MVEEWRDIEGFPYYQVSNNGKVRSMRMNNNGTRRDWSLLKLMKWGGGKMYDCVDLYKDGKATRRSVHTLVLEAFVGPTPKGMVCCHGVNGPRDNSVENLSWGTQSKNCRDKERDGTHQRGSQHANSVLNEELVLKIKELLDQGELPRVIGLKFNISTVCVAAIKSGCTWSWLTGIVRNPRKKTSKYKGVYLHTCGRWVARYKGLNLGMFATDEEAGEAMAKYKGIGDL